MNWKTISNIGADDTCAVIFATMLSVNGCPDKQVSFGTSHSCLTADQAERVQKHATQIMEIINERT